VLAIGRRKSPDGREGGLEGIDLDAVTERAIRPKLKKSIAFEPYLDILDLLPSRRLPLPLKRQPGAEGPFDDHQPLAGERILPICLLYHTTSARR